jgi:hypothetical protein
MEGLICDKIESTEGSRGLVDVPLGDEALKVQSLSAANGSRPRSSTENT